MTARERRRRPRRRRKICMASLIERNAAQTDGERATHRQTGARAVANEHLPPFPPICLPGLTRTLTEF